MTAPITIGAVILLRPIASLSYGQAFTPLSFPAKECPGSGPGCRRPSALAVTPRRAIAGACEAREAKFARLRRAICGEVGHYHAITRPMRPPTEDHMRGS